MAERDEYGHVWFRCPICKTQLRADTGSMFRCVKCGIGHCLHCVRAVNVFDSLSGRKSGEAWLCHTCRESMQPRDYHYVAPILYE